MWKFRQCIYCHAGPGQRERVDRSLIPSNIRVVASGQQRTSAPTSPRGRGTPMQQAMIPTGYNHQPSGPAARRPLTQTQQGQPPTGTRISMCGPDDRHDMPPSLSFQNCVHSLGSLDLDVTSFDF